MKADIRQSLVDAGCDSPIVFADGLPFILEMSYGKYGGEFHYYGRYARKIIEYKKDRSDMFRMAQVWAKSEYNITQWEKTPFGTWMEKGKVQPRIVGILGDVASAD